jgi:AcrR family transcriptional regulator
VNYDSACQATRGEKTVTELFSETEHASETERPLRADARRNRERILQAAREVFAKYGIDAQMDDIAQRAGVGVGTVYRHFPTKEALMAELVRQTFRRFAAGARDALQRDGEPFAVFAEMLRRNADELARDAGMQQVLTGAGEHIWAQSQTELDELNALTAELIAHAQQAGTMRVDVRATDIGMLMCGLCATMTQSRPGFDWHRHLELGIDTLRAR